MRFTVVTPPEPVVSTEMALAHLRLEADSDEAELVTRLVAVATAHLDAPDGWLGRAIGAQTLSAAFDRFDEHMPLMPAVQSIGSVTYRDVAGAEQTLDGGTYRVVGNALTRAFGNSWPSARGDADSVTVTFDAGYEGVPAPIQHAILLMVGDLYAQRETFEAGTPSSAVPMSITVERLLAPYRVW